MRNVAVVTTSYPQHEDDPSGHFVRAEVRELRRRGVAVSVFSPRGAAFGWPGIAARLTENPWRAASLCPSLLAWRLRYQREHRAAPFARTIAHWVLPSALVVGDAARELELVSHGGDIRLLLALPARARRTAVRWLLRRTVAWRFASASLFQSLNDALDAPERARLSSIVNVIPPALDLPAPVLPSSRPAKTTWVSVARLVRSKRVDLAIAHAKERRAHLVVIGDGPERLSLQRLARTMSADVRFLGTLPRREAIGWIQSADALLHASEAEGLSSVVREAESLGTPVIVL